MFLLVKQVSKSSATLEQTQEPAPKPCRYVNCHLQTAENELATHTHLSPIILLMRKSEKAGLSTSRRSQHPEQTPLEIAVIYHCSKLHRVHQLRSGVPLPSTPWNKR